MKPDSRLKTCECGIATERLWQHQRSKSHAWMLAARDALSEGLVPCMRADAASLARRYPHTIIRRGDRPSGAYRLRSAYPGRGAVPSAAWYYDPLHWKDLPAEVYPHYLDAVMLLHDLGAKGSDLTAIVLEFWSRGVVRA